MKKAGDFLKEWSNRWPNFAPDEVGCRGCTSESPCRRDRFEVQVSALDKLQQLRNEWGRPLKINSAYRCLFHNAKIGGAPRSHHRLGNAFDISVSGMSEKEMEDLYQCAQRIGFSGFGFYKTFLHVDTGRAREWATIGGKWTWQFLRLF